MWPRWIAEAAHAFGLVPLIGAAALTVFGKRKPAPEHWLIALGYAVSYAADSASDAGDDILGRNSYVMLQAGLIVAALATNRAAILWALAYGIIGTISVLWLGPSQMIPLHTVAWLSIALVASSLEERWLRWALLVSFGLGWLLWLPFDHWRTLNTWALYTATRVVGSLLLIFAMRHPFPASHTCGFSTRLSGPSSSPGGSL